MASIRDDDDDDDASITLPTLPYGYRTKLFDWTELQQIVRSNDLGRLARSVTQQHAYEVHKRNLRRTWTSVTDHILCTKFGLPRKQDEATSLYYCCGRCREKEASSTPAKMTVVRNDFPYFLPENKIEHWVLWKLGGRCLETDIAAAKDEIQQNEGHCYVDFLHWINPPELQSLPDIDHVHILCLRGES